MQSRDWRARGGGLRTFPNGGRSKRQRGVPGSTLGNLSAGASLSLFALVAVCSTPPTDDQFPRDDLDIAGQIYSSSVGSTSCCRMGAVQSAWFNTRFLDWIRTMQALHNLSQRQVRNYSMLCAVDGDLFEMSCSFDCRIILMIFPGVLCRRKASAPPVVEAIVITFYFP